MALNIEILNHWFEFLRFIAPGIKTSSQDRKRPVAWVNGEGRDNAPACVILDIDLRRVVIELGLLKRGQSIDVRSPGSDNEPAVPLFGMGEEAHFDLPPLDLDTSAARRFKPSTRSTRTGRTSVRAWTVTAARLAPVTAVM